MSCLDFESFWRLRPERIARAIKEIIKNLDGTRKREKGGRPNMGCKGAELPSASNMPRQAMLAQKNISDLLLDFLEKSAYRTIASVRVS